MFNKDDKNPFMIGGPNGAGKTTSAFSLMPELIHCEEYVNADAIAASLSPFKPESIGVKAGKLMLNRIYELSEKNVSFAFETTMSSRTFVSLINGCKKNGYLFIIVYVWLNDPNLAIERVKSRVLKGGHHIEYSVIKRRYYRSMHNLVNLYMPLADRWTIIDNSGSEPIVIAEKSTQHNDEKIYTENTWAQFLELKE